LNTDETLNSVLSGYFTKLFNILISNKASEVYRYIYSHPKVFDNLIRHLYQKSISELLSKLLNFSENLIDNSDDHTGPELSENIRSSYVYKVVQRLVD